MKLHFDAGLEHQRRAVRAVLSLVAEPGALARSRAGRDASAGAPRLDAEAMARAVRRIQHHAGLPTEPPLDRTHPQVSISMETGTGKTYTFLRCMHALHRDHGLTHFVVVVPSLAVREGILQAVADTGEHFARLFDGARLHAFVYDGRRLDAVRSFATTDHLQVMVATVQALHRSHRRIFHQVREDLGSQRPIDLVAAVRPVLVVDEPQSVDGGAKGREALRALRPLFTLRWSATHLDPHPLVYRLGPREAFARGLVKAVAVAPAVGPEPPDRPFVRLVSVGRAGRGRPLQATVELDVRTGAGGVVRTEVQVGPGAALERVTGRAVYRGWSVAEVTRGKVGLLLDGPDGRWGLGVGEARADVDVAELHRRLIRRTIAVHLARRRRLAPRGIKVLSLFFIDAVRHYRGEQAEGGSVPGRLRCIFEEEYAAAVADLGPGYPAPAAVHGGYFSQDRRTGGWIDSHDRTAAARAATAAASAWILRDKTRLLSPACPLEFLFSHSALQEGWDNPNVFQICALRDISGERRRRQTLGRGLRLCVGPSGRRVEHARSEPGLNVLTVIAAEGVRAYAAGLQRELAAEGDDSGPPIEVWSADAPPPDGPPEVRALKKLWTELEGRVVAQLPVALPAGGRGERPLGPVRSDPEAPEPGRTSDGRPTRLHIARAQRETGLRRSTLRAMWAALEGDGWRGSTDQLIEWVRHHLATGLSGGVTVAPLDGGPRLVMRPADRPPSADGRWIDLPEAHPLVVSTPLGALDVGRACVEERPAGPRLTLLPRRR